MAQLIIVEGENRGKSFELKRPTETLGRAADNTIVINDRRVSGNHAEIVRTKTGYEIKNLDRTKAILVNGEVFKQTRLQHGDWVTIADTTFVFSEDSEPQLDRLELQSIDTDDLLRSQIHGRRKGFEDADSVIESLDRSNVVDQRFKLLLRLVNRLSATLDLQRLCDKLADQLCEAFEADRVVVLTMEDERRLKPVATRSRRDADDETYAPSRTVIREVLNSKEGVLCTDAVDDERFLSGKSLVDSNVRSFMYVPCVHHSRIVAILQVDSSRERSFKEADLDLLSGIAQFVAVLIENCKVYRKGREYNQQLFHLSRATQRLSSILDRDQILREVGQIVTRLLGCTKAGILLLHDDGRLHLESVQGMTKEVWAAIRKENTEIGERFCRKVVEDGRPLLVQDIKELGYEPNARYATRSFLIVPIASKTQAPSGEEVTKVLGVMTVTDKSETKSMARTFSGNDQKILDILAGQLAIALKNAELYEKATVDGLTKVYLRRHFEQRLEENLVECAQNAVPLSLLILDIDHFKHTNDTYGHQAGDEVLRTLGALLKRCVRPQNDTVARYGGEEFTVILPGADGALAQKVATRILRAVETERFQIGDDREIQKTTSIGIATVMPGERETMARLIKKADYALYEAKETGRNRVVRWSDELLQKLRRSASARVRREGEPGESEHGGSALPG
ncbi:MAG: diguanylate cyclase [Planctomycetota bacterium]|nr:diguanylate cyclase [Planctomycetota bacterium]